ncbi:Pyruvate synthase subunit PorC [Fundidesulfovibrio magnetotacticus]|uniref:Pyruvate synthase subunit PorC n=1 Tax=Fundidesulfovibrio magnetotacticus TaxID=2730080 RepID=A0A6V8LMH8_9BACT|nr:2-oxoacid:acceptor oxidoreductase family protein [Fundidesulfovibrio magnetotacticus]GFK92904.1 Pyruvate synthase subunit PorC [Fundidesulfovibrio magnetotacticus]
MYADVIIAGFGGQGVVLAGTLLAQAAMEHGLHVTFMPVYGPEMRGGTANCTVVLSDEDIGSPIIQSPVGLIALNRPSLEKFQPRVTDQGVVILNSSLMEASLADAARLKTYAVPCNEIAEKVANARMVNMVALGAFVKATGCLPLEAVQHALDHVIPKHYSHLVPKNALALQAGYDAAGA